MRTIAKYLVILLLTATAKAQFIPISRDPLAVHIDGTDSQVQATFDDTDHSPDAVGEFLYDNTVAGFGDGLFAWYDDDEIRYIVDVPAGNLPGDAEDDYVLAYDKVADEYYFSNLGVQLDTQGEYFELDVNGDAMPVESPYTTLSIHWQLDANDDLQPRILYFFADDNGDLGVE